MKQKMAASIKSFRMPRYDELPNTGLYLEQTTQYINGIFAPLRCIGITSSMISNYVKKGFITGPTKKLYYAEQIAYLIFIAIAKNVLSMEHIQLLCELQKATYSREVAYDYLCSEFENLLFYIFGLKNTVEEIGSTNTDEKMMLREVIIAASNSIHLANCFHAIQEERNDHA